MTSRPPYLRSKTIKRQSYWCSKPVLLELNLFVVEKLSFVPLNLHKCWPIEQILILYPCTILSVLIFVPVIGHHWTHQSSDEESSWGLQELFHEFGASLRHLLTTRPPWGNSHKVSRSLVIRGNSVSIEKWWFKVRVKIETFFKDLF